LFKDGRLVSFEWQHHRCIFLLFLSTFASVFLIVLIQTRELVSAGDSQAHGWITHMMRLPPRTRPGPHHTTSCRSSSWYHPQFQCRSDLLEPIDLSYFQQAVFYLSNSYFWVPILLFVIVEGYGTTRLILFLVGLPR
jgi:hypothetical protein